VAWARGSARCGEVCACARVWVRLCICPRGVFLLRDRRFDVANAFLSLQVLRRLLLVAFPLVFSAGWRLCVHRFVASVLFGVVVFFGVIWLPLQQAIVSICHGGSSSSSGSSGSSIGSRSSSSSSGSSSQLAVVSRHS